MSTPESWGEPRSRTITWHDPLVGAKAAEKLSGLEYLQAMARGELPPPPIAQTLAFELTAVEEGKVWFSVTPDESVYNPIGLVHGGLVCTLLDSVAGCAVHSTLPAGVGYTSIEIKVNYLRPVRTDTGPLIATGWVTKPGRRVAFAEGEVRDGNEKVVATCSSSVLVIPS